LLLLLTGIAEPGCTGTETGNPPRASISFALTSSDAKQFSVGEGGEGVEITAAHLGVKQLAFSRCGESAMLPAAQDVSVDLRDGKTTFEVPEGSMCVVYLILEPRDIDWASIHPAATAPLSLGIAGLTTAQAPLFVEYDAAPASVAFLPDALEVKPGTELVLTLDIAKALNFSDVVQAPLDNDGAVVFSSQENASQLAGVLQRWSTSWSLYSVDSAGGSKLVANGG
jgi:hypothetical protein